MATKEGDEFTQHTEEWLYIGIETYDLKKSYNFERPTDTGCCSYSARRPSFTKGVIPAYAKPGSRWEVTITSADNAHDSPLVIRTKGPEKPRYLGMIDDVERCAVLQATHAAAEVELRMLKKAKADMSDLEIDRILEPLREEYAKRNRVGKAALLAVIYSRIGLI